MANMTFDQLVSLIKSAGIASVDSPAIVGNFSGRVAEGMAAIALAESKGDPKAHNTKPPDDSYGLWQINMYGKLGPDRRRALGLTSDSQLFDPMTNARAAVKILKSQGPGAWSTYSNGAWREYYNDAGVGWVAGGEKNLEAASDAVPDSIRSAVNSASQSLFRISANAGVFVGAIVLLILAVLILMRQPLKNAATKTATVVGGATPIGKAAGVVKRVTS